MAKFNEKTIEIILKARKSGLNQKECAEVAGINEATLYKWLNKGKKAKREKYRDFYNDFQMAKNKNKLFHLKKIHEAEAWTASAWYLERVYPEEFGRKDRVDLKHEAQVEVSKTVKEAEEYFKQLEEDFSNK
jgi:transcriptional regulator with XRE-family HTH domain